MALKLRRCTGELLLSSLRSILRADASPQVTPSGVRTLGYKFYIIWAVFNFSFIFAVYFFYFETSGRTLEDMDQVSSLCRRCSARRSPRGSKDTG